MHVCVGPTSIQESRVWNVFSDRPGSPHDVERLKKTFEILHFELFQNKPHINLTKQEISLIVQKFVKDPSTLPRIVFVMSHGTSNGLLDIDDIVYNKNKCIINHFKSKRGLHLKDTLKLVVIQACR